MKQPYLVIVSGAILLFILTISWCGRTSKPQYTGVPAAAQSASPTASPAGATASPSGQASPAATAQSPTADFRKTAETVRPAVVLVSVFDEPGKLLRTGTGFFISADGKLVTSWHTIAGAAHAVAKTSTGGILNVTGSLAQVEASDLAVLQAEVKKPVPFLTSGAAAAAQTGRRVAAVASALARGVAPLFETTISARNSDENGERLDVTPPPPNDLAGAPVVNEKGELVGMVASQAGRAGAPNVVRTAGALDLLVAKIGSGATAGWSVRGASFPAPPGEAEGTTPQPTKPPRTATAQTTKPKIIYDPKPAYPAYSYFHEQGSGRFRITFSPKGTVKSVDIVQSTRSATLDNVTVEALRRWRATPGQEWNVTVPVTFERRR